MTQASPIAATSPDPDSFFLDLTRTFAAPREAVYAAWTDPEHLKQWWGPEGMEAPIADLDVRTGGKYRTCMRSADGSKEVWVGGEYKDVAPPERLIFTWAWEHDTSDRRETLVTVEFRDLGDATEVALTHQRFATAEDRDNHNQGWTSSLDCLAKLF